MTPNKQSDGGKCNGNTKLLMSINVNWGRVVANLESRAASNQSQCEYCLIKVLLIFFKEMEKVTE